MKIKGLTALLLCLCLIFALVPAASAEGEDPFAVSIIDQTELTGIVEKYLSDNGIKSDRVGIGFCYTRTGDEWYLNGDEWFYPASVYKVPLMMQIAQKVANGELSQTTNINGLTIDEIEEYIIVYSNNDWAHTIRKYLGGDEVWRAEAKKYARLTEEDYSPDYMTYCYFSPRYITEVLETLYYYADSFPSIIEYMGQAMPGEYLRRNLEGTYPIAQKYGSFVEQNQTWNHHSVGIIYTPNPIIVSIMTKNIDNAEKHIGKLAELLADYARTLDSRIAQYEQEKLDAQKAAEEAAKQQAEAERVAAEEAEKRAAQEEAERQAALEKAQQEAKAAEKQEKKAARREKLARPLKILAIVVGVAFVLCVALVVLGRRKPTGNSGKAEKQYRFEDDDWDEPEESEEDEGFSREKEFAMAFSKPQSGNIAEQTEPEDEDEDEEFFDEDEDEESLEPDEAGKNKWEFRLDVKKLTGGKKKLPVPERKRGRHEL